jgi:hypothetical protein
MAQTNETSKIRNLPRYLFKYLSVDEIKDLPEFEKFIEEKSICYYDDVALFKKWNTLKQIISHKKLYLGRYIYLNDPFECLLNVNYSNGVENEIVEKYFSIVSGHMEQNGDLNFSMPLEKFKEHVLNNIKYKQRHYYHPPLHPLPFGVCSLSANPCNIQMWSYYAKNHTGVCVAFEINWDKVISHLQLKYPKASEEQLIKILNDEGFRFDFSGIKFGLQKVKYSPSVLECSVDLFMKAHFNGPETEALCWDSTGTKHSGWSPEEEWRLVCFNQYANDGEDLIPLDIFDFIKPRGILLGAAMNKSVKNILKNAFGSDCHVIEMMRSINEKMLVAEYALRPTRKEIENLMDSPYENIKTPEAITLD